MFKVNKRNTLRVLLVDDDVGIVEAMKDGLARRGYNVKAYADPAAALAEFVPRSFDVAVLDVRMGAMGGLELYGRLKGLDPLLAVCFLSAYSDSIKDKPDGTRFLQKPITLSDLDAALVELGTGR